MTLYVQYNEDGSISGTVRGNVAPPDHPRQLALDDSTPWDGMRVDLDTKTLVPCPIIATERHNNAILFQLQKVDEGTIRALRDFHLNGDSTALQSLEEKASDLRKQLIK